MHDCLETFEVPRFDVAKVQTQGGEWKFERAEGAALEEMGVEPGDVVARLPKQRHGDRAHIARVSAGD